MFSKLSKLMLCLSVVFALTMASDDEETATLKATIFDNDSEFMRGFETGLFLRSKGGTIEEYGCAMPEDVSGVGASAMEAIKTQIELAKGFAKLDPIVDTALTVVVNFLEGLMNFMSILAPSGRDQLD